VVTVSTASSVNSLVVSGPNIVLNATRSLNVISGLTVSLGATFETGLATSFCGTLLMDRGSYLVGVASLPPQVLRVSGLATLSRTSLYVRTSLPTNAGWFGAGQDQVAIFYGGATTGFAGVTDVTGAFAYTQVRYAAGLALERYASSALLPPATGGSQISVVPLAGVDQVQGWVFAVGPSLVGLLLLLLLLGFFLMSRCDKTPQYVQVREEDYTAPVPAVKSNSTLMAAVASTRDGEDDYDYAVAEPPAPRMFQPDKAKQSWSESHSYDGPPTERGQGKLDGSMPAEVAPRRESTSFFRTEDVPMEEIRYATLQLPPSLNPPPPMEPAPAVMPTRSTETFEDHLYVTKSEQQQFPPPPNVAVEEDREESGFSTGEDEFPEPPMSTMLPPPSFLPPPPPPPNVATEVTAENLYAAPPSRVPPSVAEFEPSTLPPPPPPPVVIAVPAEPVSSSNESLLSTGMIPLRVEFPGGTVQNVAVPGRFTGQEALEYIQAKQGGSVSSSRMGLRVESSNLLYGADDFKQEPNYPFLAPELPIEHYGSRLRDATLVWDELQALLKVRFVSFEFLRKSF
jgi:hypothetical protein